MLHVFPNFEPDVKYEPGQYVFNGETLYRFIKPHVGVWTIEDVEYVTKKMLLQDFDDELDMTKSFLNDPQYKRYGVRGIGLQTAALTRLYDAVGMTAQVGTDGSAANVANDFDNAAPFMHRKCVGNWTMGEDGYPKFNVQAYLGEEGYAEDGTKGDYVAVELPRSYYYLNGTELVISGYKYEGYRCFDIFCRDHDQNNTLEKVYVPAYALALNASGKAVSLPGLDNSQGDYKTLFENVRKYNNNDVKAKAMMTPAALEMYYWAMMVVEFATQNLQSVMYGCAKLRSNQADLGTWLDETHLLLNNYDAGRVVGEYIAVIGATESLDVVGKQATHKILSITRCTNDGTASNSGTYSKLELQDLGKDYIEYDTTGETQYRCAARGYRTGDCNSVVTPSGSPVSNSDGYHPMRYRYRENVYANQYHTCTDLFNIKKGTGDDDYYLEWYYLPDPSAIETPVNPTDTTLQADPYVKLGVVTEHANYVNGYIKSRKYDEEYPDIWIAEVTSGGSDSTYYCDYANVVNSYVYRAVRFGGNWNNAGNDGFNLNGNNSPANGNAYFGAALSLYLLIRWKPSHYQGTI